MNNNKNDIITVDMLFSYWILLWFFIYILFESSYKWVHKYFNPLLAFYFGLLENMFIFIKLFFIGANNTSIQFFFIIMLIKAFPIYILQNHHILWKNDLIILILIFLIYNFYLLYMKRTNLYKIYNETEKSISNNENRTPLLALITPLMITIHNRGYTFDGVLTVF